MPPRRRDALLRGLLDTHAADGLESAQRRKLVNRALRSGITRVRRAALDRLCELDGAEAALRRARSDRNRTVGAWVLTAACPRTGTAWTSTGSPHKARGLKHRHDGTIRFSARPL